MCRQKDVGGESFDETHIVVGRESSGFKTYQASAQLGTPTHRPACRMAT